MVSDVLLSENPNADTVGNAVVCTDSICQHSSAPKALEVQSASAWMKSAQSHEFHQVRWTMALPHSSGWRCLVWISFAEERLGNKRAQRWMSQQQSVAVRAILGPNIVTKKYRGWEFQRTQ